MMLGAERFNLFEQRFQPLTNGVFVGLQRVTLSSGRSQLRGQIRIALFQRANLRPKLIGIGDSRHGRLLFLAEPVDRFHGFEDFLLEEGESIRAHI